MSGPDQERPNAGQAVPTTGGDQAGPGSQTGFADQAGSGDEPKQAGAVAVTPRRRTFNEAAHKLPQTLRTGDGGDDHSADGSHDELLYDDEHQPDVIAHASRAVMALLALGVVYGDLGTSPLYTEQVTFGFKSTHPVTLTGVYGVISLIFWATAIVVSTKYSGFIMRAHNRGDGGVMALAALCRRNKVTHAATLVTLGIFGASLFFGDGMITPAISVLSAVSGLQQADHSIAHLIVPISLVILVGLFAVQRKGSGTVGWLFGPVMLLWFLSIAAIGIPEVVKHPGVLQALSPTWAVRFFLDHGFEAFLTLGGIVLCTTGAEALYADRGHFGPGPIRIAWFGLVWPAVLLNYMGQATWLVDHPTAPTHPDFNPFYSVVPSWFQFPEVVLATLATVIASQAVISGSYTIARQAMQLGYLPRLRIMHTSEMEGQIYVPVVNWILAGGVVALVLAFQSSNKLANAYGLAVTGTFILDTILFLNVSRALWHTPKLRLGLLGGTFLAVEVAFFLSNVAKLFHGAWLPLAVGGTASVVMLTWRAGQVIVTRNRIAEEGDLHEFLDELAAFKPPIVRVPGTAVFLNASGDTTPLALRSLVEHTHALPEKVLIVSIVSRSVPHMKRDRQFSVKRMGQGRYPVQHVVVRSGYRDTNRIPELLQLARKLGHLERNLDLENASYFISRMTITDSGSAEMAKWRKKVFLVMAKNAASPIEHFGLPIERTVLMGSQVSL